MKVNKDKCLGCGVCISVASDLLKLECSKAKVIKQPRSVTEELKANRAINICPVGAIS